MHTLLFYHGMTYTQFGRVYNTCGIPYDLRMKAQIYTKDMWNVTVCSWYVNECKWEMKYIDRHTCMHDVQYINRILVIRIKIKYRFDTPGPGLW